jgi:hypothetical protein
VIVHKIPPAGEKVEKAIEFKNELLGLFLEYLNVKMII